MRRITIFMVAIAIIAFAVFWRISFHDRAIRAGPFENFKLIGDSTANINKAMTLNEQNINYDKSAINAVERLEKIGFHCVSKSWHLQFIDSNGEKMNPTTLFTCRYTYGFDFRYWVVFIESNRDSKILRIKQDQMNIIG